MIQEIYFEKYHNKNYEVQHPKLNEFIDKLANNHNKRNIEYKITQIEKDYTDKLKHIEELCNNNDEIENIIKTSSLIILQKELEIIKLLNKYILQNKTLNYNFLINVLKTLLIFSEELRKRLGQKEIIHDKIGNNENCDIIISRCSYKFCSFTENCSFNYQKVKNLCYQDHYVHAMVSADLKILLDHIYKNYAKYGKIIPNKEILKSINTLNFVIYHMEAELKNRCHRLPPSEHESQHIIKNK
jgi:hypothetical protein